MPTVQPASSGDDGKIIITIKSQKEINPEKQVPSRASRSTALNEQDDASQEQPPKSAAQQTINEPNQPPTNDASDTSPDTSNTPGSTDNSISGNNESSSRLPHSDGPEGIEKSNNDDESTPTNETTENSQDDQTGDKPMNEKESSVSPEQQAHEQEQQSKEPKERTTPDDQKTMGARDEETRRATFERERLSKQRAQEKRQQETEEQEAQAQQKQKKKKPSGILPWITGGLRSSAWGELLAPADAWTFAPLSILYLDIHFIAWYILDVSWFVPMDGDLPILNKLFSVRKMFGMLGEYAELALLFFANAIVMSVILIIAVLIFIVIALINQSVFETIRLVISQGGIGGLVNAFSDYWKAWWNGTL